MTPEMRERIRQANIGKCHTEESKQKMSKFQKERWTDELRAELSEKNSGKNNPMYGKHHSEKTKEKLREMFSGEKSIWYGKPMSEEIKQKIHDANPLKVSVIQLNLDGSYVGTYSSMTYAANSVNGAESSISECCNGNLKSAYGYLWVRESDYDANKKFGYCNNVLKSVVQLDLNENYINEYKSVSDAAKSVDGFSQNIGRACKSGRVSKGFKWMYKKDYKETN